MLKPQIKSEIKELISLVVAAEIVKVDDVLYVIKKGENAESVLTDRYNDFETIFETSDHHFGWWEIREDAKKLNNREWKIGDNIVSFYTIQPI